MTEVKKEQIATDDELIRDVLSKGYIFANAKESSLDALAAAASIKSLSKGEVLFAEGEVCRHAYILVAGRVAFYMHDESLKRYTLGLVPDYSIFGDLEIFSKEIRSSHAEAHEESKVLVIDSATFKNIVRKDAEILYMLIRFYSNLLERLTRYSLFRDVEKQLAYIVVDFAKRYGIHHADMAPNEIEIDVHLSQEFLGSFVGIPRQRINVILKSWVKKEWIKINYSRITLLNEPALRAHSII